MGDLAVRTGIAVVAVGALYACNDTSPNSTQSAFELSSETLSASPSEPAPSATPKDNEKSQTPEILASDGTPRRARLSIPALGIRDLPIVPYVGKTDDARGTGIQDKGLAASPHGPRGGVGPGGIGNYQVTAHRLSSTQAFLTLPALGVGESAYVDAGGVRYHYEIRDTRRTSFRSPESLEEQRAAVPGKPGKPASRAFITLSTCATLEDRAQCNFWTDKFDNPEHRIDKIGVLVRSKVID